MKQDGFNPMSMSGHFSGITTLSDKAIEDFGKSLFYNFKLRHKYLQKAGHRVIREQPQYKLMSDNCQKFALCVLNQVIDCPKLQFSSVNPGEQQTLSDINDTLAGVVNTIDAGETTYDSETGEAKLPKAIAKMMMVLVANEEKYRRKHSE